jgi:phosphate-selective porin OprO/OprP
MNMRPVSAPSLNAPGESPAAMGTKVRRGLGAVWLLLVVAFQAAAQDVEPVTFWKRSQEKGLYERLWEVTRLYENETNPVIQAFSIIGRYNGQYWAVNADQGNADGWENRRIYLGAEAILFRDFTLQAQVKLSEDLDPIYDGLYQAFVKWSPDEAFSLSAGRVDFSFAGLERTLSSTKIATFERGLLVNQLLPAEVVGTVAQGKVGDFFYRAGAFSGSIDQEFTDFAGGFGAVAGVGYELPLFCAEGRLHLDYLYNNGNPANNAFRPYDHVVSLWHQGQSGPFGLGVDVTAGHGIEGRTSVLGVTVLPTYVFWKDLVRKGDALQAVLRYQYAVSDGDNGLQLQSRYEQEVVPGGVGNAYHAVYAGINYLIYRDRFKLMNGVEYSVMKDSALGHDSFNGWTFFSGVRVYF